MRIRCKEIHGELWANGRDLYIHFAEEARAASDGLDIARTKYVPRDVITKLEGIVEATGIVRDAMLKLIS